jgi:hypothetical protein
MSTPMTAAQIVSQLKRWDVPFRELEGWRTHERDDETGLTFGPVFGCVTHHTGDDAPDSLDRKIIWEGRSDLPGPLAQFGLNDDGVVDLHSAGRANHAGGGDPRVLEAVKNESYVKYPPPSRFHQGEAGAIDGNDCFYGVECYYSGSHRMTPKQYASLVKLWAAVCDFHNWSAKSVIGHKEWSDWKVDPGSVDMHQLRLDVDAALKNGPQQKVGSPRVESALKQIDGALALLNAVVKDHPNRNKLEDVVNKIEIQRSRLD